MTTPRPYDKSGPYTASDDLTSLLVNYQSSLVTPEYQGKPCILPSRVVVDDVRATSSPQSQPHRTLQIASDALAITRGCLPSPREAVKATLAPRPVRTSGLQDGMPPSIPLIGNQKPKSVCRQNSGGPRLNKFVRRLHDMILAEKDSGVVEWRRGLLVLFSTDVFAKKLLPKYFATKNFKTFRRQLNYYGFVHVRSFNTTGASPTALWVNRSLANEDADNISSVLKLKRVEPCETARTAEGRRHRKELAKHTVEQDIGVSARTLQMDQIRCLTKRDFSDASHMEEHDETSEHRGNDSPIPREVHFVIDPSTGVSESSNIAHSIEENEENELCSPAIPGLGDIESEGAANLLLMLSRA